jgi:hypothetical protein
MVQPLQDRPPKVSILVLPQSTPSSLYGLYEVFASVGRTWEELTGEPSDTRNLEPRLVARCLDPIQSALGFAITPNGVLDDADVVIVTDIAIPDPACLPTIWEPELVWLRERHAAGAILCSVCTGTAVLAEAGLLDDIEATTHWFVIVCLALIVSPLGRIRLGGPEATPDYGYVGWFSMLFAAGMGIGLMFFGVSEPLSPLSAAFDGRDSRRGRRAHRLGAAGRGRGRRRRGDAAGHGRHDLPLGPAPLGDLCRGGAGAGAVQLQQGPAADAALGLLSDLRRTGLGLAGPCHRHPRGLRHGLRAGDLARHRGAAGGGGAELPVRPRHQQRDADVPDHLHHRHRARLDRARARRRA